MDSTFIGQIVLVSFDFSPVNFFPCDGRVLSKDQYPALFALIGESYGGDGVKTFALPDTSTMNVVPGFKYLICVQGIFPQRP